ncbi:MAG: hypothetical protein K8T20_17965 [Planctomycetes bacterium]|nr:hypothetical protein [Planctomycetota bacterium]
MARKQKKEAKWAEAKRGCRLNDEEIAMAKALGMSPRGLMKNVPGASQQWKAPVLEWIRDLHAKRFGKRRPGPPAPRPAAITIPAPPAPEVRPEPQPCSDDIEPPF